MSVSDEDLVKRFPGQTITHDNADHYRGRLDHRLLLGKCRSCQRWQSPPKPVCPQCWSFDVESAPVSGDGTIYMAIFLRQGPPAPGVDYSTPYPVVTVELDEQPGLRFTATVLGAENDAIRIGERVRLGWIERAGMPVPVFELSGAAS
ncbi:Zn-ribbon domain-containing OB-fold protein [Mycobacterium seoulense]|uniref:Zn-ribbon domain-containing OB-fold protein n=1 Tax=Mycobacterium seoulense TaxID=386911 RepID=UPI003CFA26F2